MERLASSSRLAPSICALPIFCHDSAQYQVAMHQPESWGYVQFEGQDGGRMSSSTTADGAKAFPALAAQAQSCRALAFNVCIPTLPGSCQGNWHAWPFHSPMCCSWSLMQSDPSPSHHPDSAIAAAATAVPPRPHLAGSCFPDGSVRLTAPPLAASW